MKMEDMEMVNTGMVKTAVEKKHQTEIFEYIKRNKGRKTIKVGVIFGTVDITTSPITQTIKIGWSKCNFKSGDKFSLKEGLQLAKTRAFLTNKEPLPICIKKQVRQFGARCVRYFKDATKLELPA